MVVCGYAVSEHHCIGSSSSWPHAAASIAADSTTDCDKQQPIEQNAGHPDTCCGPFCVVQDLDELQCHLLLKRWLKDNDVHIQPPKASSSSATPAGGGLLALPAPPTAATAATPSNANSAAAAGMQDQSVLPADVVQEVADYYAQERLYLSKCQQYIVMTASKSLTVVEMFA